VVIIIIIIIIIWCICFVAETSRRAAEQFFTLCGELCRHSVSVTFFLTTNFCLLYFRGLSAPVVEVIMWSVHLCRAVSVPRNRPYILSFIRVQVNINVEIPPSCRPANVDINPP
jgi:hypothetical protein